MLFHHLRLSTLIFLTPVHSFDITLLILCQFCGVSRTTGSGLLGYEKTMLWYTCSNEQLGLSWACSHAEWKLWWRRQHLHWNIKPRSEDDRNRRLSVCLSVSVCLPAWLLACSLPSSMDCKQTSVHVVGRYIEILLISFLEYFFDFSLSWGHTKMSWGSWTSPFPPESSTAQFLKNNWFYLFRGI